MLDPKARAEELIKKYNIQTLPVPVEDIARKLGAKVIMRPDFDDDLDGMIVKEGGVVVIGVNDGQHNNRKRFTIAHEIGHLVLHGEIIEKVHVDKSFNYRFNRDGRSRIGQDRIEIEANRFAAELLMPEKFLKKEKEISSGCMDFENGLTSLAEKYGVSVQAMAIRLSNFFAEG